MESITIENIRNIIDSNNKDVNLSYMKEFLKLYENRPIRNNQGGMKSQHCFWVWYLLKLLKPTCIIESGLWRGQSTWLIENTCPTAKLFCIDVNLDIQEYKSKKAVYTKIDFLKHNWKEIIGSECNSTLAFIDDHQNNYERLIHGYNCGLGYMIFEDNYPFNQGDVLSLKKIFTDVKYVIDINNKKTWHTMPDNYKNNVLSVCDYLELPPPFLDTKITRWNDLFLQHNCKPPLINKFENGLEVFKKEQLDYTFIAVVKLKII
jgi:hypothetical protein